MRLDCVGDEIFLCFPKKMVGPMVLFMHFLVLFMGPRHFLVLFMGPTILFQLIFTFIYNTFSNKFSILAK